MDDPMTRSRDPAPRSGPRTAEPADRRGRQRRAAAARRGCAGRRGRGGRFLPGLERARPQCPAGAAEQGRGRAGGARAAIFVAAMMGEIARPRLGPVQPDAGGGKVREAAALTTQIGRRHHPVRQARAASLWRCASRPESCSASRRGTRRSFSACARSGAARLRQHGHPQGLGTVPGATHFDHRRGVPGGRLPGRRRQSGDQRHEDRRRGRRRADRPSGVKADQFHRIDPCRPDHREAGREHLKPVFARAGRQGAL